MPPFLENENSKWQTKDLDDSRHDCTPMSLRRQLSLIPEQFVCFQDKVLVRKCSLVSCKDCDDNGYWYSEEELRQIKDESKVLARRRRKGECLRGLEQRTNRGYHEALKNRLTALAVVLEAQRNHPKQLASAYSAVTKNCREEAIKNAIIDAAEANPYQEDDDDENDSSSADLKGCFDQLQWLSSWIRQIFQRD